MISWFRKLFSKKTVIVVPQERKLVLTSSCADELDACIAPDRAIRHEGVALLLGLTGEDTTLATHAIRPHAHTSQGSFEIPTQSFAKIIKLASRNGLAIVGQVHTHPRQAYHSDGDYAGLHIQYPGFCSLVLPNYGDDMPSIDGLHAISFESTRSWQPLAGKNIVILAESLS